MLLGSAADQTLPDPILNSRATSVASSDSEDLRLDMANNIGSDQEADPLSPDPPLTRGRSSLHQGGEPELDNRNSTPPALVNVILQSDINPDSSQATAKEVNPKSTKKRGSKKKR